MTNDDDRAPLVAMVEALRAMQDAVAAARPDKATIEQVRERIEAVSAILAPFEVEEADRVVGRQFDLPGRVQALTPRLSIVSSTAERRTGLVDFSAFHAGSGGVVNGGVIPLVFTDMVGLFSSAHGRPFARMAYLNVDFKAPVMIDTTMEIEATLDQVDGRKTFISSRIHSGGVVHAEARSLFVAPRE